MVLDALALDVDVDVMAVDGYDSGYMAPKHSFIKSGSFTVVRARARVTPLTHAVLRVLKSELDI